MACLPLNGQVACSSKEQWKDFPGTSGQQITWNMVPSTHELGSLFTKEKREGTTTEESGEIWGAPLAKHADRNATASWTGRINT